MRNNKMNGYIISGMLIHSALLTVKQFVNIPDIIACFGTGMSIALMALGIYTMKHDISKIKAFKRNLIKKFIQE